MSDSTVRALFETASQDPDLLNRFRSASTPDELRSAVTDAGFDPDHPEIAAAIAATTQLDTTDLGRVSGGFGSSTVSEVYPEFLEMYEGYGTDSRW